jgi:hypothetical protein
MALRLPELLTLFNTILVANWEKHKTLQLSIQCSSQLTPKRHNSKPHGATRQQQAIDLLTLRSCSPKWCLWTRQQNQWLSYADNSITAIRNPFNVLHNVAQWTWRVFKGEHSIPVRSVALFFMVFLRSTNVYHLSFACYMLLPSHFLAF